MHRTASLVDLYSHYSIGCIICLSAEELHDVTVHRRKVFCSFVHVVYRVDDR